MFSPYFFPPSGVVHTAAARPAGTDDFPGPGGGQNCEFNYRRRNSASLTKFCDERRGLLPGEGRIVLDLRDSQPRGL
jgi:hypothetical protein